MEALRALKRHLSDVVYRHMVHDDQTCPNGGAGPGGHIGSDSAIQRGQPNPDSQTLRTSHSPQPAARQPRTSLAPTP